MMYRLHLPPARAEYKPVPHHRAQGDFVLKRSIAIVLVAGLAAAFAPPTAASGSTRLTPRAAKHALRVNLARGFGIHGVKASCERRSPLRFACRWRGIRGRSHYRGRAAVLRSGRSITVQLSRVRRAR
jgi:hypothetical protein